MTVNHQTQNGDPTDPRVWWRKFVDAVIGLQRGDKTAATAYLRFTDKHRGYEAATAAQKRLPEVARSEAFENAREWPANGYAATPKKGKFNANSRASSRGQRRG